MPAAASPQGHADARSPGSTRIAPVDRGRPPAVVAAGGTAPAAAAAYELPDDVATARGARAAMASVDTALVATYADAAAAATGDDRRLAARTAADCAVRAVAWGAAPQAFPARP